MSYGEKITSNASVYSSDFTVDYINSITNREELASQSDMASVEQRLEELEDQVLLVRRDAILEEEFEELKEAWQAYNDLLAKLKTFKALKDSA